MTSDAGKGYRRVVPSPKPISIVEADAIKKMFDEGFLIVHSGGGGIPVVKNENGSLAGVEAVIDKDLTAGLIATLLKLDVLLILTDVEKLALNFGRADQKDLDSLSIEEAKRFLKEGQFPPGSMGPKVEAGVRFVESGDTKAIIASLNQAGQALERKAGTVIS